MHVTSPAISNKPPFNQPKKKKRKRNEIINMHARKFLSAPAQCSHSPSTKSGEILSAIYYAEQLSVDKFDRYVVTEDKAQISGPSWVGLETMGYGTNFLIELSSSDKRSARNFGGKKKKLYIYPVDRTSSTA